MSWHRVWALIIRYAMLYKRNVGRLFDIFFWPIMDAVVWGFVAVYLLRSGQDVPTFVGFFLGAMILWDTLFRSSLGISVSFLEDLWTKNFLNLFASPLRPGEFIVGTMISSFSRVVVSSSLLMIFASVAYGFNILTIGAPLALFFAALIIMGWSLGLLVISLILRFGQGAEIMAWALTLFFQPLSAVFYPVAVLPSFLQIIAHAVPSSHVFEGLRILIATGTFSTTEFAWAIGLDMVYIVAATALFFAVFKNAKKTGRLVRAWQ